MTNTSESCTPSSSDSSLASRISDELFQSGYGPLRSVSVKTSGGVVTLKGRVPSFYLKQLAQHRAIRVPGAVLVDNQIVVEDAAPGDPRRDPSQPHSRMRSDVY